MKRLFAIPVILGCVLAAAGLAAIGGCKQGEGERCQVTADCDDGLICNQATFECVQGMSSGPIDVLPPIDGPPLDTPDAPDSAIDAAPDAAPDAPPDAAE